MNLDQLTAEELNLVQLIRKDKRLADYVRSFQTHYMKTAPGELTPEALVRSMLGLDEDDDIHAHLK